MRYVLLIICVGLGLLMARPVSVDEILTKRLQFKLMGTLSYVHIQRSDMYLAPISVPINGGSSYVQIPLSYAQDSNQDYLNFSLYARYGLAKRVEIFSTLNSFWQHSMISSTLSSAPQSQSYGDFSSLNLGILIQAKKEGKLPALLLGASADVLDKSYFSPSQTKLDSLKGYTFFATSFYTIDPIVLLLQANFRLNLPRAFETYRFHSGHIFALSPMVYFAVNPYISLNFGIRYQYATQSTISDTLANTTRYTPQGSSVSYVFGLAYEIKSRLIFYANAEKLDTTRYSSDMVSLTLSYRI